MSVFISLHMSVFISLHMSVFISLHMSVFLSVSLFYLISSHSFPHSCFSKKWFPNQEYIGMNFIKYFFDFFFLQKQCLK